MVIHNGVAVKISIENLKMYTVVNELYKARLSL